MGIVCSDFDSFLNLIQITGNTELENRLLTESKIQLKVKLIWLNHNEFKYGLKTWFFVYRHV